MGLEIGESYVKKTLKNLCLNHGWSYGVFWRFDPQNHMLLTVEDAYYENHVASVMDSVLVQVQMLGEGLIGEAALDGKHRWMFVNGSIDHCKTNLQFSAGIKTVAVIPIELRGVVQLGSTKEIFETQELLDQTRKCLQDNTSNCFAGLAGSNSLLSNSDVSGQNGLFDNVSTPWTSSIEGCLLFDSLPFSGEVYGEQFEPGLVPASALDTCQPDDLSQWLADTSKLCVTGFDLEAMLADDMTSELCGSSLFSDIRGKQQVCSSQSSLTNAMDFGCGELGDVINAVEDSVNPLPIDASMSFTECISGVGGHTGAAPKKGLFSELGLEHLLKDGSSVSSITRSSIEEDQWPPSKKRKTEANQSLNNQLQQTYHSWGVKMMQPTTTSGDKMQDFGSLKERVEKAQERLWIDESYNMDAKSCISAVNTQSKRTEEPPKATKKRARPGESTRPRPKDRQLIADRIKDLRDLIPNGAKLSIDSLLNRTIKHMLFLQNLNKHARKLKQVDESKLTGPDNSLGCSTSASSGGIGRRNATWAYEVGGSNLLCPIIVEDLNEPGQMLIEMLCEEQGYFLEIAEVVRGFGLTILKGVMESRNNKIWAHFIVEGNKHVTRMDVFVSLMQLLQGTNTSEVLKTTCEAANIVTNAASFWGDFQQHVVPLPI